MRPLSFRAPRPAPAPAPLHVDVVRVMDRGTKLFGQSTPSNRKAVLERIGHVLGRLTAEHRLDMAAVANGLVDRLGEPGSMSTGIFLKSFNCGMRAKTTKPASVAVDTFMRWVPTKPKRTLAPGTPVGPSAARTTATLNRARMPDAREDIIHIAVADALREKAGADVIWWHTPNGGHRAMRTASLMKAQGVQPGIPDLLILVGGKMHCLELKNAKGRASPEQKTMLARFAAQGALTAVTKSYDEAIAQLAAWGIIKCEA